MASEEQLTAAYEHLKEAARLLSCAGRSLLAEEVEELALQPDLQAAEQRYPRESFYDGRIACLE